jgi:hypothetical protein
MPQNQQRPASRYQNQNQPPQIQQPQFQPQPGPNPAPLPAYRPAPPQPGEYELQNQHGFAQWQQMNGQGQQQQYQPQQQQYSQYPFPQYTQAPMYVSVPVHRAMRSGKELMVHASAELPAYCVKCNEDASIYTGGAMVTQKYRWHHPAIYALIFSPLIYVVVAAVLSKRATIQLPLCGNHLENRKNTGGFLIGAGVVSALIIFFVASAGSGFFAFFLFLASMIGIGLSHEYFYKPLRSTKIDNDYVYLKGVDSAYLSRLPY